jgi:DNA-directed RNA polymerase specialized sigma24 family protein
MAKDRYVWLDGVKIPVTEEVYRAYYRPVWREAKQKEVRDDAEYSLDALEEVGFEAVSNDALVDEIVADKLLLDELYAALDELTDDERGLINALYFDEKSERDIAAESGVPQTTINYRKKRLLEWLRKKLKDFR